MVDQPKTVPISEPAVLGYALVRGWSWRRAVLAVAVYFTAPAIVTSTLLQLVVIYKLDQFNSYLARDGTLALDTIGRAIESAIYGSILLLAIRLRRFQFPMKGTAALLVIGSGVFMGLARVVPTAVDIILTGGATDDGGNPKFSGRFGTVQSIILFAVPVVVGLILPSRRRQTS